MADEIPFNSRRKFHLTVHQMIDGSILSNSEQMIRKIELTPPPVQGNEQKVAPGEGQHLVLVKGAPEYVLTMCDRAIFGNIHTMLNSALVAKVLIGKCW